MKKKLTTLLFGLLLAVGWTSSASAQALPEGGFTKRLGIADIGAPVSDNVLASMQKKATAFDQSVADMVLDSRDVKAPLLAKALPLPKRTMASAPLRAEGDKMKSLTKAEADNLKYTWTDAQGTSHESKATDEATDPYQMYELLRFVYGNPAFPGPTYSAYKPDGVTREDPVYYGAVAGGWNISAAGSGTSGDDITITASNYYASIASIKIYNADNDQLIINWDATTEYNNGNYYREYSSGRYYYYFNLPTGWSSSVNALGVVSFGDGYAAYFPSGETTSGTLTIPYSALNGATNVRVVINAATDDGSTSTIQVNGGTTASMTTTLTDYTWTLQVAEEHDPDAFVQGTVQAPAEEGYTALVVSVKDDATAMSEPSAYNGSCEFSSKLDIVNYFSTRIQSIKLLTDGIRIGSDEDYSAGTVFSCDGTYNKFFFLGKGQARKKADAVLTRINNSTWPAYCGEEVPFENMFEQFSPTTGGQGDQITDFYSKMNEGNVYNVVHDCASVLQNGHQFSMSGNSGTQAYAMTGLNFFIPDYRLMWFRIIDSDYSSSAYVDGRDMNPYCSTNSNTGNHNSSTSTPKYFAAWFAQYNTSHAPKVGIYKITLDATAEPVAQLYAPGNKNYQVTLTWVSSLNEMSGHDVPQTYTVWYFDENGERQYVVAEGITDGQTGLTKITYLVEQFEHSYTIDYIVQGSPDDTEHPQFIAVSNIDGVVIPGWNDFVGLELDHNESDFVVADMANWYRNFLSVVNEDLYNGLTVSAVTGANGNTPMNKFSLYRYNYNGTKASGAETKVADIELFDATPAQVSYRVTYDDDASDADMEDQQVLEAKYQREAMGFKDEGVIRVRGNGDLVIWPNNYYVNFKSITVKDGTQTVASWNAATMNKLPEGWETSPGSKWEEFTHNGVKVGYMEGGGYIYIPNMLNRYNNLSVEIEAFGEGANVKRITVNDETKDITATAAGTTYTWTTLSPNALHAPKMAAESHTSTLNFTAKCNGSGTADDGATWTVTSDANESDFDNTKGIHYGTGSVSVSYLQLATSNIPGTIKSIVVNASRASGSNSYAASLNVTVGGAAFGSQQTLTTSAANYTFTGSASGNIVVRLSQSSRARALYCKSITVTYETESGGEQTTTANLTVCDGNYFATTLPVNGSYFDCAQHNQMVYPASMLTAMAGKKIKSMTFYPTSGYYDDNNNGSYDSGETTFSGINFYDAPVTFKLANLSSGTTGFADENPTLITGTMTPVKTLTPTANSSATTWVITFDQEFEYNGGDLLIDVTSTDGTYSRTAFTVDAVDTNLGANTYTYNGTNYAYGLNYLPKVTFTYETEGGEAPAVEGGLLRMHMLLVDQFKQEIPADNSHPDAYGYVLRFEPNGPNGDGKKQSGTVKVDIEKTDAQPNSYYTKSQIDNDKNIDTTLLTMDILDAQVKMNLNDENPNVLYFQMQGAGKNAIPDTYLTQLQYMKNVRKYEEMLEGSHKGEQYDADEVHYYFNDATPEIGAYSEDYKAYAPSVSTWGIDRRYYEADGLDNTYGAPVWKTAVGKAKVLQVKLEKQVAKNGGVNQSTTWTDANGASCDLYILDNILVDGYLPSADISNVKYVPYMFRVFVKSPNGKLRHYIPVEGTETTGSHLVNDPEFTNFYGPISVYEQNVQNESIKTFDDGKGVEWSKSKNTTNWSDNAIFGALSNMIQGTSQGNNIQFDSNDLQVFVRFYYMVEGWNANRGGEARPGNGSESPGFAPSPWTAVDEVRYNGEVVSTTYVNAQGVISEKPFDGFNIVITRYSDGTTRTTKVMQ